VKEAKPEPKPNQRQTETQTETFWPSCAHWVAKQGNVGSPTETFAVLRCVWRCFLRFFAPGRALIAGGQNTTETQRTTARPLAATKLLCVRARARARNRRSWAAFDYEYEQEQEQEKTLAAGQEMDG
jgi:hypothetical protein